MDLPPGMDLFQPKRNLAKVNTPFRVQVRGCESGGIRNAPGGNVATNVWGFASPTLNVDGGEPSHVFVSPQKKNCTHFPFVGSKPCIIVIKQQRTNCNPHVWVGEFSKSQQHFS